MGILKTFLVAQTDRFSDCHAERSEASGSRIRSYGRYINGKLDYAAYYKEDGQVKETTGQLIDWITRKSQQKPK